MSNALAIDGVLYFNTYEPKSEQDSCSATQGVSYAYRVNLLDGTAVNNTRYSTIKGASLPSNPQLFCKGDTCWVYNDPSNLIPTNKPACPVGQKCDDECLPGEACAVDVSAKSRLYWADEED
jgi:type IV pilus assembly protein PilY1